MVQMLTKIILSVIVNAVNERLPFSFEFGTESGTGVEATLLRLDLNKIRNALDWQSKLGIDDALKTTIDWQEALGRNAQMLDVTLEQTQQIHCLMGKICLTDFHTSGRKFSS